MNQVKFVEDSLGRLPKLAISLQIFERLSSTNFTLSILEYLDPYEYR